MIQRSTAYEPIRVVLAVLCALLAAGGLFVIVATSLLLAWTAPHASDAADAWLTLLFKALGVMALFIAYSLYLAARDPVRYVGVIDGLVGLLVALSVVDIYAATALGMGAYYPLWAFYARAAVRVAVAVLLLALRPRAKTA